MTRGVGPLLLGLAAIVVGTWLGAVAASGDGGIAAWPPLVRAALVGLSVAIGTLLLARSVTMLAESRPDGAATASDRDMRTMIRAVRLAFLAVAAFASGGAWLVGSPLLLIVALIIAGVDVVETSFLLLIARTRKP